MASGNIGSDGVVNDGIREKQRFKENKVYTRRAFRGPKKNLVSTAYGNKDTAFSTRDNNENHISCDKGSDDHELKNDDKSANPTTASTPDIVVGEEEGRSVKNLHENASIEFPKPQETATLGNTVVVDDVAKDIEKGHQDTSSEAPDSEQTVILKDPIVDDGKTVEKVPEDNSSAVPESERAITMADTAVTDVEDESLKEPELQQTVTLIDTTVTDEGVQGIEKEPKDNFIKFPESQQFLTLADTAVSDEQGKENEKRPDDSLIEVIESHKTVTSADTDVIDVEGTSGEKEPEGNLIVTSCHTAVMNVEGKIVEKEPQGKLIEVPESQRAVNLANINVMDVHGMSVRKEPIDKLIEVPESQHAVTSPDMNVIDVHGKGIQKEPVDNLIKVPESRQTLTLVDAAVIDEAGRNIQKEANNYTTKVSESTCSVNLEGMNLTQQQHFPQQDGKLNDLSHLRQHMVVDVVPSVPGDRHGDRHGVVKHGLERTVKINLALKSRQQRRELCMKLESELEMVRSLIKRIEAKEGQFGFAGLSTPRGSTSSGIYSKSRTANLEVGPMGILHESSVIRTPAATPRQTRSLNQLSISLENSQGGIDSVEKEKRTPKANPFYKNSEFLLAKDKFPPAESNKKAKLNGKKQAKGDIALHFRPGTKTFKKSSTLLEKLMKHKYGWVFNSPVDVKALGLHDYFLIIKHPMDLGTIKTRLNSNWYKTADEFAEDVRLTFSNAMRYNPNGHDVHIMAETLSGIFEDKWPGIKLDYDREILLATNYQMSLPTPTSRNVIPFLPPALDIRRTLDRSQSMFHTPFARQISVTPRVRTPTAKKPKAKDPHKRDMTFEERQKLSTKLQTLPLDKLENIVQIINKRGSTCSQKGDLIEVDMDKVDNETLWEMDRFVTNYKKNLSKHKRKAELALKARAEAERRAQEQPPAPVLSDTLRETKTDERNPSTSLPVQPAEEGDNGSSSSSSSDSSSTDSSSSDSDSDSSSSSESS